MFGTPANGAAADASAGRVARASSVGSSGPSGAASAGVAQLAAANTAAITVTVRLIGSSQVASSTGDIRSR